jgi:uncharacterized protein (TIGR02145 family)
MVKGCCSFTEFSLENQICENATIIKTRCGTGNVYHNPATEKCCGNAKYTIATEFCQQTSEVVKPICGDQIYYQSQYCSAGAIKTYGNMVDKAGNEYKTVEIGTQTWVAENLNYAVEGSRCYGDNTSMCNTYGRLYDWETAMAGSASSTNNPSEVQGVCPSGWHLPSVAEWNVLINYVQINNDAGRYLKATSTSTQITQDSESIKGEDKYGFAALFGGYYYSDNNPPNFVGVGTGTGRWWTSEEFDNTKASTMRIGSSYHHVDKDTYAKSHLNSVRCLKD